jgi:hypothetical protein
MYMIKRLAQSAIILILSMTNIAAGPFQPALQTAQPVPQAVVGLNSAYFQGILPGGPFPTEYVEIPYNSPYLEVFSAITLEAWVKRYDATRSESIICNDHTRSYCLFFIGGNLSLTLNNGGPVFISNGTVPTGIWTHVAATYDGSTVRLYINGILDSSTTYYGGIGSPLAGTSLGIGADLGANYDQNYFYGWIDNVRLWNFARTGNEIRDGMFTVTSSSASYPKPVAEWRFDGDTIDYANTFGFNGTAHDINYSNDGALPHDIRIPLVSSTPALNGICDPNTKYSGSIELTDSNTLTPTNVYLMRTSTDLWVCFNNLTAPTSGHDNWVAVYLDPAYTRYSVSQATDYSLEVHNNNNIVTRVGNGAGDYTVSSALNGQWSGIYYTTNNGFNNVYNAEFRISNTVFGGSGPVQIGLGLAQHWITGSGDDRLWPALSAYNSPHTWSSATLSGPGTERTFSGQVLYETRIYTSPMSGIGGMMFNLVGYDPGGTSAIVAVAKSNTNGYFTLDSTDSFSQHRVEVDAASIPKGLSADFPKASPPAVAAGPLTIDWGAATGTTFTGNTFYFHDQAPLPLDNTLSQHLLIITSQAIASAPSLNYYLNFKQLQGFTVEVATVENIQATSPGADLVQKIRNFEINRRAAIGPSFKYVLLIGSNNTIPFGSFNGGANDANFCHIHATDGWPTEWFYVDLTSNWDTNGNGCYGDGIFGDKGTQASNNYTPDASGTLFQNTVSLGRIPLDDPTQVINALFHSMHFEQQSGDFKRQALLASSMMDLKTGSNACWLPPDDPNGAWYGTGGHTVNGTLYVCDFMSDTGTDGSYLSHAIQAQILSPLGINSTLLFENALPVTGASPYQSPTPLSESAVQTDTQNNNYGLVQLMGHGNGDGVFRLIWNGDANNDGMVNNPTQPIGLPPTSVYEMSTPVLASRYTGIGPWAGTAPIFIVASCTTGDAYNPDNFGANLLAAGKGVAWVGGTGTLPYTGNWTQPGQGNMQDIAFNVTRLLLTGNYRLGDALWTVMHSYMAIMQTQGGGWWAQDMDLYGDPTITFYGNGGADALGAAWPMLRNNSAGLGYTSLTGPVQPTLLWSYPATARVLDPLKPSPLVTNRNDVVVSYFNYVDVVHNGTQAVHLTLNAPVFGTPALADDGTIYAVTIGGLLYAFSPTGSGGSYVTRWTFDLGAPPTTSPIIGPDGFIAIGHQRDPNDNLAIVSSLGTLQHDMDLGGGEPVGAVAIAHDRTEFVTTTAGGLVKLNPSCGPTGYCDTVLNGPTAYSTPPLLANNSVYAGRDDGTVVRFDAASMNQVASFTADSAIVVGPILGPGGQVLVGTQSGTFYSLSLNLTLRWQKTLGTGALSGQPAFTSNGLYVANGNFLDILDPSSGAQTGIQFVATGAGGGTVAAGYNRQVFIQTSLGPIVAIGEGWLPPIDQLSATSILTTDPAGGPPIQSILVKWSLYVVPMAAISPTALTPTGILVQRSQLGGPWQDLAVLPLNTTQYNDPTAQPGIDYSYRLQVLDANGNDSDFTDTPDVHNYPNLPTTPTISAVTASGVTSLTITWSNTLTAADAEVNSYRLERSAVAGGPYTAIATLQQAATTYEDTGLTANTTYFYRLFATNSTGDSAPSAEVNGTTRSLTLSAPQNLTLTSPSAFNYTLSWTGAPAAPGAIAVIEQQVEGQEGFTQIGTVSAAGPFNFEQVNPGYYQFRVKFVAGNAESPYAATIASANVANFAPNIASVIYLPFVTR